jgi:F420-non-reducing hydrogenase iron-sulfur subunit
MTPPKGKGAAPGTKTRAPSKKPKTRKKRAAPASAEAAAQKTPPARRPKAKKAAPAKKAQRAEKPAPKGFTPRIVVFACNWCSYAGADTAGISRIQYSPHFRIIRVMCSGRVHPAFVLRAFELGADGVLVSGCHFGDCHYIFGNERAVEQFEKTKALLKILGVEEGRIRLEWISASEGVKFARVIDEFVEQVRALGPSKLVPRERELPRKAEAYADAAALAK